MTEFAIIKETNPTKQTIGEGTELAKIGQMLVGTCCSRLCLRHLTATDIISSKADYVTLSKDKKKLYLFSKLKDGSSGQCLNKQGKKYVKIPGSRFMMFRRIPCLGCENKLLVEITLHMVMLVKGGSIPNLSRFHHCTRYLSSLC